MRRIGTASSIETGPDAIDRAASVAEIVVSTIVRGHANVGVGLIRTHATHAAVDTATRIAAALGVTCTRVEDADEDRIEHHGALLIIAEAKAGDERSVVDAATAMAARRPRDARTSVLLVAARDARQASTILARAMRMDPDDVNERIM